uniref:Uncharacterized protein n=1 Tax=Brassica oleracea var. oleracea TaxID=109376 RepID=A0A0D2ZVG9_BRAOL
MLHSRSILRPSRTSNFPIDLYCPRLNHKVDARPIFYFIRSMLSRRVITPTVPVNHYSDPEGQHKARPGQLRPGAYRRQKRQADRCSPKADRATHPKVQL